MKLTSALMRLGVDPRRAVLLLALMVSTTPSAQSVDVTITGIVTDPSGAVSLDARLSKVIRFTGRRSVTGFVGMFNVTNAVNLRSYVGALGSNLFGQPTAALEKRRTQVGLRVDF